MSCSILDVAKKANVSKSTVSRVITGGSVSEKAAIAVRQAMKELNYHPNHMAQGLRGTPSQVIGVAVHGNALVNKSITMRLAGINEILSRSGYSLLLINLNEGQENHPVENALRYLAETRIDGLIFLGDVDNSSERKRLTQYREIVYTGERLDKTSGFRIYMGNYNYSRDLYSYLMENGHHRILTVYHFGSLLLKQRRIQAYKELCEKYHISFTEDCFLDFGDTGPEEHVGMEYMYQTFTSGHYTGVFADSVELGNRMVNYFTSKGLKLKEDYSIVTIERGSTAETKDSLLTSVCLPDYEYGKRCGNLMLKVIQNPELIYDDIIVPYTLEIRNSVRNLAE